MNTEVRYLQLKSLPAGARRQVAALMKEVLGVGSGAGFKDMDHVVSDKIPLSILTTPYDPDHPDTFSIRCGEGYKMEPEGLKGSPFLAGAMWTLPQAVQAERLLMISRSSEEDNPPRIRALLSMIHPEREHKVVRSLILHPKMLSIKHQSPADYEVHVGEGDKVIPVEAGSRRVFHFDKLQAFIFDAWTVRLFSLSTADGGSPQQ